MAKTLLRRAGDKINTLVDGAVGIYNKQATQNSYALQGAKLSALFMGAEVLFLSWYPVAWLFTYVFSLVSLIRGETIQSIKEGSVTDFLLNSPTMPTSFLRLLASGEFKLSPVMMTVFVVGFSLSMLADLILPFVTWGGIADLMTQMFIAGIAGAGVFVAVGAAVFLADFARVAINEYYPNFFSTVAEFVKMVWNNPAMTLVAPIVTAKRAYAAVTGKGRGVLVEKEGAEHSASGSYAGFTRVVDQTDANATLLVNNGQVVRETIAEDGSAQYDDMTAAAYMAAGIAVGAAAAFSSVLSAPQQPQPTDPEFVDLPNLDLDPVDGREQITDPMVDVPL